MTAEIMTSERHQSIIPLILRFNRIILVKGVATSLEKSLNGKMVMYYTNKSNKTSNCLRTKSNRESYRTDV